MRSFNHLLGPLVPTLALVGALTGACATGGGDGGGGGGEDEGRPDARDRGDAAGGGGDDPFTFPPDAEPGLPTPDAAAAAPAACTSGTWTSIGTNTSFDGDPLVWSQFSSTGVGMIMTQAQGLPVAPPSPLRAAWLGGADDARDQVYQTVSVPVSVGGLRVSAKVCVATQEENPEEAFDLMGVTLHNAETKVQLEPALKVLSNLDAVTPCGFKDFTANAATPHAGEDLIVVFGATTDMSKNTNFFVDSVKIEAMVCP